MKKKEIELSFGQLTLIQIGVFATAVLAFLLSMAWNNVVQAYTEGEANKKEALIIYASVLTVGGVLAMTLFAYIASKHANIPATHMVK